MEMIRRKYSGLGTFDNNGFTYAIKNAIVNRQQTKTKRLMNGTLVKAAMWALSVMQIVMINTYRFSIINTTGCSFFLCGSFVFGWQINRNRIILLSIQ